MTVSTGCSAEVAGTKAGVGLCVSEEDAKFYMPVSEVNYGERNLWLT